jgi:putative aldouronate transport system substrate-binding protein
MKVRVSKLISAALVTLMVISLLTACASNNNNASTGKNAPPSDAASSNNTQNTANNNANQEHRTLTVEVFDRGKPGQPDLNNNYWTQYINDNFGKEFNATVEFVTVPRSEEVQKLNVLMASNDAPDIVFTYDSSTVYKFVQQGGLTDLSSVLEQHGPGLVNYLGDEILKYGQFDGKQYAIPGKRTVLAGFNTFIRKDWLDKLDLPVPTSAEQFYETMVAFKEKNPGNVTGVIPYGYSLNSSNPGIGDVFEAFKPSNLSEKDFATLQAQNVTLPPWNLPGYDSAVQFINKMYNEGLISPNFATDKDGQLLNADISNGKVGAFYTNWDGPYRTAPGTYNNLKENVPGAELIPIDPWQNDAGKHPKQGYSPNGMYILVPKFSKNVDLAIQYLNWMVDPKNTLFLQNGKEGEDYNMVNGVPVQTGTTTEGNKMMTVANNLDYDILSNGIELGDPQKNAAAISAGYPGYEKEVENALQVAMRDYYAPYYHSIPNEADAKYRTQLVGLSAQLLGKLIVGKPAEFDSLYKSSVQQFMNEGGKAFLDEYIKNYDTQNNQ